MTPREVVRANPKADRDVILYGYLRGTNIKPQHRVHIAGVGDFTLQVGPAESGFGEQGARGKGQQEDWTRGLRSGSKDWGRAWATTRRRWG